MTDWVQKICCDDIRWKSNQRNNYVQRKKKLLGQKGRLNWNLMNTNKQQKKKKERKKESRNNVAVLDKFDANGVPIFSFKKCCMSIYSNVSLHETILKDARIFSFNAIFTSSKFHR